MRCGLDPPTPVGVRPDTDPRRVSVVDGIVVTTFREEMPMITSSYPVLMSDDVAATAGWFIRTFGFEPTFESDWYVSMRSGRFELAVLAVGHETIPAGFSTAAGGILINIEVDDVDAEYRRIVALGGTRLEQDIRSEAFGQRHFIVSAPGGVLIDVIQPIEPTGAFAASS